MGAWLVGFHESEASGAAGKRAVRSAASVDGVLAELVIPAERSNALAARFLLPDSFAP